MVGVSHCLNKYLLVSFIHEVFSLLSVNLVLTVFINNVLLKFKGKIGLHKHLVQPILFSSRHLKPHMVVGNMTTQHNSMLS